MVSCTIPQILSSGPGPTNLFLSLRVRTIVHYLPTRSAREWWGRATGTTDLEIVWVFVCPRQKHGSKEVPRAHKDGVHLAHLHLCALGHCGAVRLP